MFISKNSKPTPSTFQNQKELFEFSFQENAFTITRSPQSSSVSLLLLPPRYSKKNRWQLFLKYISKKNKTPICLYNNKNHTKGSQGDVNSFVRVILRE